MYPTGLVVEVLDTLQGHCCKLVELVLRFDVIRDLQKTTNL